MKITRNTPTQLIVENTPWFFAVLLSAMAIGAFATGAVLLFSGSFFGGALVLLVSAVIFPVTLYFIVQRVQVILDTPTNTMTIRRRTFLGYSEVVHTLAYLSHAELDTSRSSDTPTHCPIFVLSGGMSEGHHKFTPAYQSGPGPARVVDAVNTWLNDARQNGHFPAPVDSGPPEA